MRASAYFPQLGHSITNLDMEYILPNESFILNYIRIFKIVANLARFQNFFIVKCPCFTVAIITEDFERHWISLIIRLNIDSIILIFEKRNTIRIAMYCEASFFINIRD